MRVSLPPGTMLSGNRSEYEVKKFIGVSDRSISVICKDRQGREYRLKLYDGEHPVDGKLLEKCLQTVTDGVVRFIDSGSYQNCFFMVCENYPFKSIDRQTISVQTIRSVILPGILSVMHAFHERQVVLRDIAPEHILYDHDSKAVYYLGFSNILYLGKKAAFLREPGYGQKGIYIAPEAEKRGYGPASDHFSLGVMLLNILKGEKAFEGITQEAFYSELKAGRVPGIDIKYLKNTSYDMYSTEDKLYYLILGLLIPDPDKRWGYG
ncbi:MAG: serine/threonine-protein kinase, partial [Lachnospiraceae bacterium]|nr:serine/threonine-protein kinase [Lachnospiraceae bacterium]